MISWINDDGREEDRRRSASQVRKGERDGVRHVVDLVGQVQRLGR